MRLYSEVNLLPLEDILVCSMQPDEVNTKVFQEGEKTETNPLPSTGSTHFEFSSLLYALPALNETIEAAIVGVF